jgi:hypothetical protein
MRASRSGHLAYLLRLWRVGEGERAVWRASLQDVRGGERVGFPGLEEAFAFLQEQVGLARPPGRCPRDRECTAR